MLINNQDKLYIERLLEQKKLPNQLHEFKTKLWGTMSMELLIVNQGTWHLTNIYLNTRAIYRLI